MTLSIEGKTIYFCPPSAGWGGRALTSCFFFEGGGWWESMGCCSCRDFTGTDMDSKHLISRQASGSFIDPSAILIKASRRCNVIFLQHGQDGPPWNVLDVPEAAAGMCSLPLVQDVYRPLELKWACLLPLDHTVSRCGNVGHWLHWRRWWRERVDVKMSKRQDGLICSGFTLLDSGSVKRRCKWRSKL